MTSDYCDTCDNTGSIQLYIGEPPGQCSDCDRHTGRYRPAATFKEDSGPTGSGVVIAVAISAMVTIGAGLAHYFGAF